MQEMFCYEMFFEREVVEKTTFGIFGSLDKARKTLSKMPLFTRSSFSSQYKSSAFVLHPKNNQTLGSYRNIFFKS